MRREKMMSSGLKTLLICIVFVLGTSMQATPVQGGTTSMNYPGRCCAMDKPDYKKTHVLSKGSASSSAIFAIDSVDVIASCDERDQQFAVTDKYPKNIFCATKHPSKDYYSMEAICDNSCAVETTATWFSPGSGSSMTLFESITWSTTNSSFRSDFGSSTFTDTYTHSAKAGLKLDFIGLSGEASASYSSSTARSQSATVSKTFESTESGTKSREFKVDCPNGYIYQYRLTQKGVTPEQGSVVLDTMHFVCSPRNLVDVTPPVCPPEACFVQPGDPRDGCQCCTNDRWTSDPAEGNKCAK